MEGIDGLISPFRFNRREVSTNLRDGNAGKCKFSSDIELENLCSGCLSFFIMTLWFGLASDSQVLSPRLALWSLDWTLKLTICVMFKQCYMPMTLQSRKTPFAECQNDSMWVVAAPSLHGCVEGPWFQCLWSQGSNMVSLLVCAYFEFIPNIANRFFCRTQWPNELLCWCWVFYILLHMVRPFHFSSSCYEF